MRAELQPRKRVRARSSGLFWTSHDLIGEITRCVIGMGTAWSGFHDESVDGRGIRVNQRKIRYREFIGFYSRFYAITESMNQWIQVKSYRRGVFCCQNRC